MSKVNEAVEAIVMYKANRMIHSQKLTQHIERFLRERGINLKDNPPEVFKICAVDAMIYDVGAALDFTKKKNKDKFAQDEDVDDWTSFEKRTEMLRKIFP